MLSLGGTKYFFSDLLNMSQFSDARYKITQLLRYQKILGTIIDKNYPFKKSCLITKCSKQDLNSNTLFLGDVCDNREQLAAIFDEQNGGHYHGGGDGMSSASDSDTKEIMGGATTCSSENLLQV